MFHTIIIAGNVGRDPEMRYTPSGTPVTSFSVASSRSFKTRDGQPSKETIWFRVTCWNKLAEFTNNYVKKGSKVLVEGRLTADPVSGGPRVFTRNDGSVGASFEITAASLNLLSSRQDMENYNAAGGNVNGGAVYQDYSEPIIDESDIPF